MRYGLLIAAAFGLAYPIARTVDSALLGYRYRRQRGLRRRHVIRL